MFLAPFGVQAAQEGRLVPPQRPVELAGGPVTLFGGEATQRFQLVRRGALALHSAAVPKLRVACKPRVPARTSPRGWPCPGQRFIARAPKPVELPVLSLRKRDRAPETSSNQTACSANQSAVAETLCPPLATLPETRALSRGLGRGAQPNRKRRRPSAPLIIAFRRFGRLRPQSRPSRRRRWWRRRALRVQLRYASGARAGLRIAAVPVMWLDTRSCVSEELR